MGKRTIKTPLKLLLAAVAGISLMAVTAAPPEKPQRPGIEKLRKAADAQKRHRKDLMEKNGVRGSAVSWRKSRANPDGEAIVKVYTNRLKTRGIPRKIDGVPVEVEYVGEIFALTATGSAAEQAAITNTNETVYEPQSGAINRLGRFDRPVPIGISVGHPSVTAGTIGCRVSQGCHTYMLSNNHVIANKNNASIGDDIIQPGSFDGGSLPDDAVGQLYDFVAIEWHPEYDDTTCGGWFQPACPTPPSNYMDAAIAEVQGANLGVSTTAEGYGTPRTETMTPYVGMKVMKYGRTTGMTYGYIDSINATIDVNYGSTNYPKYARFASQIIIKPAPEAGYSNFSLGGDSGSLIVAADGGYPQAACVTDPTDPGYPCAADYPPIADERKAVGLLYAGGGGITLANKIDDVLTTFDVLIDGE